MNAKDVLKVGEYLGFCEQKGYMYTVFKGIDYSGLYEFNIYAYKNGFAQYLISYTAPAI